jgi:hypothetical protein
VRPGSVAGIDTVFVHVIRDRVPQSFLRVGK